MSKEKPNFTVITTGGCNAKCDFCTDPMNYKPDPMYIPNLMDAISTLPRDFEVVSVSGGEPTISPDLDATLKILKFSGRFKRIVLTTNGTKLLEHIDLIASTCTHVNISRHAIGYNENVKVFKNKRIINDKEIEIACKILGKKGIPVSFNFVYTEENQPDAEYVSRFIGYAKSLNVKDICFRYDHANNSLEPTKLEEEFKDYHFKMSSDCPVCRTHSHIIDGMECFFKASFVEPSNQIGGVYELIYHPSAKLTTDWDGKHEYRHPKPDPVFIDRVVHVSSSGSCGRGGC